ncbi:MAG TPA: MFS transporter [Aliiroseovarius sp.]|nr:MFS transporter [Aliiroseovarius sp.]
MSSLVFQLTGSTVLVGAVTAILRFGWLFPQLFVGFLAGQGGGSMRYYVIGAFGRALAMAVMALVLWLGQGWPVWALGSAVMVIWTFYAFVSGIVAVPYNDIVARAVPSQKRSRLLALRFFGGGVLALGVAGLATRMTASLPFPLSYAAIIAMASVLMLASSTVFTAMGEPEAPKTASNKQSFQAYLRAGVQTFRTDTRFRLFVFAQWCGGAVLMAMPFYVVAASGAGFPLQKVALLLGAQTAGALVSNPLWGWWGDHLGKVSLLRAIAAGRILPPLVVITLVATGAAPFGLFLVLFALLGALANGLTIAVIGFLMEISPEDQRPAYSGYFNAITAPAFLLPLFAGGLAYLFGLTLVFGLSLLAAIVQTLLLLRIDTRRAARAQ